MSLEAESRIEQVMTSLREQTEKMHEARAELDRATASATSKDRMVTVTVGPQGQVISMNFRTTAYQEMAPAELADVLTNVLNEARGRMGEQVTERLKSFANVGEQIRMAAGFSEMSTDLDELFKPLRSMRPGFEAEEAKKRSTKQEEFNG